MKKRVYWKGPETEPSAEVIALRNAYRNELTDMFRHAQWEAWNSYVVWEAHRQRSRKEYE